MRTSSRHIILFGTFLFSLGCVQANPGFEVLDQNSIPRPTFSGQTTKTLTVTSMAVTTTVHGECDIKISSISAQVMGVPSASSEATLSKVAVTSPTLTCQTDGKFHFELKSLTDLGFAAQSDRTYEVQLRGNTSAGLSGPSSLFIHYTPTAADGPRGMLITSGSTESSSGKRQAASTHFRAEVRIDHASVNYADPSVQDAMTQQSSTHFKAKIGTAAR